MLSLHLHYAKQKQITQLKFHLNEVLDLPSQDILRLTYIITLMLIVWMPVTESRSQSHVVNTHFSVFFPVGKTVLDTAYTNNGCSLSAMLDYLSAVRRDSSLSLLNVQITGMASPEGSYQTNRRLANRRAQALASWLRAHTDTELPLVLADNMGVG